MKPTEEFIIEDTKHHTIVAGRAINQNELRLITGSNTGEVLHNGEFKILERLAHSNVFAVLGMAWTIGL